VTEDDLAALEAAFDGIPGVIGFGYEYVPEYPIIWVIADVPRDDVASAVYNGEDALLQDRERRGWEFLLVAADDPDMTDAWEGPRPPNFHPVAS